MMNKNILVFLYNYVQYFNVSGRDKSRLYSMRRVRKSIQNTFYYSNSNVTFILYYKWNIKVIYNSGDKKVLCGIALALDVVQSYTLILL